MIFIYDFYMFFYMILNKRAIGTGWPKFEVRKIYSEKCTKLD